MVKAVIVPKTVKLSWNSTSFTYDGKSHAPKATAKGLIKGDSCTVNKVSGAAKKVGTQLQQKAFQIPITPFPGREPSPSQLQRRKIQRNQRKPHRRANPSAVLSLLEKPKETISS